MARSRLRAAALLVFAAAVACAPSAEAPSEPASPAVDGMDAAVATVRFSEVQQELGLGFVHRHGGIGGMYPIETMCGGGGFLDFDGDGWLDIYLVQSGPLPDASARDEAANRLFRNEGGKRFVDVTAATGSGDSGYGMGICAGDYDNDGDEDLFVTNYGPNQLYRNDGSDGFTNVTDRAGVAGRGGWSSSAAFADYDQDGDLDLYVVNYVIYSLAKNLPCGHRGFKDYCHPDVYPGLPDVLYRNEGDGTFTDVTEQAGVLNASPDESKGLGIGWFDQDDDGDLDIYVANDSTANFLYRNEGDGTFVDTALEAGSGYNEMGETEAGMGVAIGDYDLDGNQDIYVTHLSGETNTLYRNAAGGTYDDHTARAKLALTTLSKVGFGVGFLDFDNNGWLDLYVANGHVLSEVELSRPGQGLQYEQTNQLFVNDREGSFHDVSATSGPHFETRRVSRGLAFGDIDNDGDLDVLIVNNNQEAVLLRNEVGQDSDWIGFDLQATRSNRSAIGTRIELRFGEKLRRAEVHSGTSYLSQHDLRLVFGLGSGDRPDAVAVRWPDGRLQEIDLPSLRFNAYNTVVEP